MTTVISVEHLSKSYRLGQIGTGTFTNDLRLWWAKVRGKPNPLLRIGETDHGNRDGETLWALKDVSFTVEQGEVLGIIGRNGAGKSTLLKILSRVTAPTSGRIRVKGRVASLLEVGTGFHPELTGRENIYLNGAILGMTRQEVTRKFDEIVDFAEVEKFIDTPVKRYSSGMYVRLAFAVAAHLEPEILVVDEVLAVGDAEFQKKCLGKMGDVAEQGRTVLFVSHNMGAIKTLCHRVVVVSAGKLVFNGLSDAGLEHYLASNKCSERGQIVWAQDERPGNDIFHLESIKLLNSSNIVQSQFSAQEDIWVEVQFESLHQLDDVRIVLQLLTNMGEIVFTSPYHFSSVSENPSGKYRVRCLIPGNILNTTLYTIRLWVGIPGKGYLVDKDDYISLNIQGIGNQVSTYSDKVWPGVICPSLQWTKDYLGSE